MTDTPIRHDYRVIETEPPADAPERKWAITEDGKIIGRNSSKSAASRQRNKMADADERRYLKELGY